MLDRQDPWDVRKIVLRSIALPNCYVSAAGNG